jgi:hypothetical protein
MRDGRVDARRRAAAGARNRPRRRAGGAENEQAASRTGEAAWSGEADAGRAAPQRPGALSSS